MKKKMIWIACITIFTSTNLIANVNKEVTENFKNRKLNISKAEFFLGLEEMLFLLNKNDSIIDINWAKYVKNNLYTYSDYTRILTRYFNDAINHKIQKNINYYNRVYPIGVLKLNHYGLKSIGF